MKIGIEAQRIFRKKKHGMDMVALELIRHLQLVDKENEYFVFVKPDEDHTVIQETANFRIIEIAGGPYPYWEQVLLPRAAKKYGCELLHCTSNTAPLFSSIPLVLTLHDIIFMESSVWQLLRGAGSRYQKFGNIYRHLIVPRLIRKCKKIITVSNYEKERIAAFFDIHDEEKLLTVYNGVSDYFQPVTDPALLQRVKEQYHLPDRYFFFLGNTHPKKNTIGVLKAYADYCKREGNGVQLVMIDYDQTELARLLDSIEAPELINQIHLTGYVNNKDLPAIYSQCELFLYPSLRESFGIPIIEAMACGAPVITSNTSSMPEVAGAAALLVDPFNPASITGAMQAISSSKTKSQQMIEAGLVQARIFSWSGMAAAVLTQYIKTNKQHHYKLKLSV